MERKLQRGQKACFWFAAASTSIPCISSFTWRTQKPGKTNGIAEVVMGTTVPHKYRFCLDGPIVLHACIKSADEPVFWGTDQRVYRNISVELKRTNPISGCIRSNGELTTIWTPTHLMNRTGLLRNLAYIGKISGCIKHSNPT